MTREQFYLHTLADHWAESGYPYAADLLRHHANGPGPHEIRTIGVPSDRLIDRVKGIKEGPAIVAPQTASQLSKRYGVIQMYHVTPDEVRQVARFPISNGQMGHALGKLADEGHRGLAEDAAEHAGQFAAEIEDAPPPHLNTARPQAEGVESPPVPEDFLHYSRPRLRARLARAAARRRYAAGESLAVHPDYQPTGIAPRLGHALKRMASEGPYSTVGGLAAGILHTGDHSTLPVLADALDEANHPLAEGFDYRNAPRAIAIDKAVTGLLDSQRIATGGRTRDSLRRARMSPIDVLSAWVHRQRHPLARKVLAEAVRKAVPDANSADIAHSLLRLQVNRYNDPLDSFANPFNADGPDSWLHRLGLPQAEVLRYPATGRGRKRLARPRRYSHEAFAAAIRRRPNDRVVRGAYADYLEENDAHADPATLDALRGPDPVWMGIATDREGRRLVIARPNPKRTMANVRAANRAAGHTWFSPGSMRFFDSRMERRVHTGPGGTYFVSSEQFSPAARRYWSVRHLHPSGDVRTHGPFQGYVSPEDAHAAAAEAAAQTPPGLTRMGRPYRAPAGGTVVRGVYYVGGSLLPDLTGPFATGQTPSRPAPPPKSRKINWAAALRRWTGRQRNR